jgi:hypothetical protein
MGLNVYRKTLPLFSYFSLNTIMRTFKEFLQWREYNTTGEVDTENNTDLDKPSHLKARWYASKKKCGLNGLPCSKYVAQMKKK